MSGRGIFLPYLNVQLDDTKFANECRIGMKWRIKEEEVKNLHDYGYLQSKTFKTNIPGVEYFLRMYPNGKNESEKDQVQVYLHVEFQMKKICADFTVSSCSAPNAKGFEKIFEKSGNSGGLLCTGDELFFNDEFMTIILEGTLKAQGMKRKTVKPMPLGDLLEKSEDDKDVTIVVGEEEIKVHKLVLTASSNVFKTELNNSRFKEAIENKIVITDFCFDTVKIAVNYCYKKCIRLNDYTSEKNAVELLHFADKYNMKELHVYLQNKLIENLDDTNVCTYANATLTSNADELLEYCICYLVNADKKSKIIDDIDKLDGTILKEIIQRSILSSSK